MSPSIADGDAAPTLIPTTTSPNHASLFSLAGKTVAVTGGGRGLGLHMALAVVEAGGSVACMDILEEPAAEEWEQMRKAAVLTGASVSYHRCDVTSEAAVEEIMEAVAADAETRGAPFWGCIAAAGVQQQMPAMDYPSADFERILRINVTGAFNTCKHTGRILHRAGRKGSIVIIASISGHIANRGLTCTAYNTSKAAVHQMCRSIAQEWGQHGIRINTISPGVSPFSLATTHLKLAKRTPADRLLVHPHCHDRPAHRQRARRRKDLDGQRPAQPLRHARRPQEPSRLPAVGRRCFCARLGYPG